jgi:hypothetical protein
MNEDFLNDLLIVVYLLAGTASIVLAGGWALKKIGPPGKPASSDRQKKHSSSPRKSQNRGAKKS